MSPRRERPPVAAGGETPPPPLSLATRPGRRWLGAALAAVTALSCTQPTVRPEGPPTSTTTATPGPASEVTIALVGTSDVHGYVEPRTVTFKDRAGVERTVQRGGLPLFGGYLDNLRRRHPVLLLDGGDLFQGTMVSNLGEGQVVIDAFNALGYTAAAIGNHEFDYGPAGPQDRKSVV